MLRPAYTQALRRSRALPALLFLLILSVLLPVSLSAAPLTTVYVNGMRVDAYPLIREGVSYLPIQAMAQALQAEITWDAEFNLVKVNGQASSATLLNQDGKIYLPIESFVGALGGTVAYNGRDNVIKITTSGKKPGDSGVATSYTPPARTSNTVKIPKVGNTANVSIPVAIPVPVKTGSSTPAAASYSNPTSTAYGNNNSANTGGAFYSDSTNGYGSNYGSANANGTPGYPAAYSPSQQVPASQIRPADAAPYLSDNLQPGPVTTGQSSGNSVGYNPMPANAQRPVDGVYVPRSAQNSVFQVTVTNLETVPVIKDFYRPRTGYKFVIAYLSQQNVSQQVQIYTGRFSMLDQKAASYDYVEGLSNFWLVILRPFGVNFGYLVFEVPVDSKPISLVLHALNQAPLTVNL